MSRRVVDQAFMAVEAVTRLGELGCRVMDVRLGGRAPVIYIEPGWAAEKLPGAVYMRERLQGRLVATYVCPIAGCQVRWPAEIASPPPDNLLRFPGVAA